MKKVIIILLIVMLVIFFAPSLVFADSGDGRVLPAIWAALCKQSVEIAELKQAIKSINPKIINEGDTIIKSDNWIVEYAPNTDGEWTKESYPTTKYRRTGYTYNGITTYVVEEIQYCWNDDHTTMFIEK